MGGFNVDAVVSVDERGQMVLPKDLRERAGIKPGDKLALISWEKDGEVCCMSLVKTSAFQDMLKGVLGPMMQELNTGK
jgi:AbrB family looped-hinge helix DNA binding protein